MNNTVLSQTPHQNIVATDLQIIYHACAGFYSESSEIAYNFTEYSKQKKRHKYKRNACKTVDAIFPFILHSIYEKIFFSPKDLKFSVDKAMLQNYRFFAVAREI